MTLSTASMPAPTARKAASQLPFDMTVSGSSLMPSSPVTSGRMALTSST